MALPEDCNLPTPLPALSREELSKGVGGGGKRGVAECVSLKVPGRMVDVKVNTSYH